MTAMGEEHVHFLKRSFVEEHVDTLAAGVTTFCVMLLNRCFTATGHCLRAVFY